MMENQVDDSHSRFDVHVECEENLDNGIKCKKHTDKIKIDDKLQLSTSIENLQQIIERHVKYYSSHKEKLKCNSPVFPSDYALAHMSSMSYKDVNEHKDLLGGWVLLTQASNNDKTNGYHGCAYFNEEHQQIVIAHRGTDSLKAVWNDLKGIVFTKFVSQMNSAITFTEKILKLIQIFNQKGAYLKLSFTGHSLGGWLAQVTTFTAKYLTMNEENNRFTLIKKSQIGYHVHTVVFESPGCKQMLENLKTEYIEFRYGDENNIEISIDTLDITTYLSAPNRINCCNAHIGQLYQIFVDLPQEKCEDKGKYSFGVTNLVRHVVNCMLKSVKDKLWHSVDTHGINKIVNCFDQQTGQVKRNGQGKFEVQEVLNWPIIEGIVFAGSEYTKFFEWASKFNNFNPSSSHLYDINGEIRYQTKDFDKKVINWSVFNETESYFLHGIDYHRFIPAYESVLFSVNTDEDKLALQSAIQTLDSMKFRIDVECQVQLLDPNVKLLDFISFVKQFNYFFPCLNRVKRSTKGYAFDLFTQIYQSESLEYLTPFKANSLEFDVGSLNLTPFLNKENSQVLLHFEDETTVGVLKIYKIFESVQMGTRFESGNSIFLDIKTILKLKLKLNFASIMEQIKDDYLIVIENRGNDQSAIDCLKEIMTIVRSNCKLKFILIVDKKIEINWTELFGKHEQSHHQGIQLSDLSSSTQKQILNIKLINFQGTCVSLVQLLPKLDRLNSTKDLIKLFSPSDCLLDVGVDYIRSSQFDVFAVSNISSQEFDLIISQGERVTLYKELNENEMVRFFILDYNQAQNQFDEICWRFSHRFRVHWLNMEGNKLILKNSSSNFSGDNDGFIKNIFSSKLQTQVDEVLTGCFVIGDNFEFVSSIGKHLLQSILNENVLFKLGMKEEIKAGSELPKLGEIKDYYIGRSLSSMTNLIDPTTLSNNKIDIFAISNTNVPEFRRETMISSADRVMDYEEWVFKRKFKKTQFIILDQKRAEKQYKKICKVCPNKNVHWLIKAKYLKYIGIQYNGTHFPQPDFSFKHEQSRVCVHEMGGPNLIYGEMKYRENPHIFKSILSTEDIKESDVIIVGLPGMGKTTFLTHLALQKKSLHPFMWVINKKMKAVPWDNFDTFKLPLNEKQAITFLVQIMNLDTQFEKSLFEYCLYDEKVVLILDAFDEASPKYDNQIFTLLEILQKEMNLKQLWLSSRPYALKDDRLMGKVYTLQGFDEDDQKKFLLKFWSKQLSLKIDSDHCDIFMREMVRLMDQGIPQLPNSEKNKSVAGIPLILKISAEFYQNEFESFYRDSKNRHSRIQLQNFAIHTLYEKIIEKNVVLIYGEKLGTDIKIKNAEVESQKRHKTTITDHQLLALVSCGFDSFVTEQMSAIIDLIDGINKGEEITGLISGVEDGVPQFIHTTFAEYFSALWLIEQMVATQDKGKFVKLFEGLRDLLERKSEVVSSLFNSQIGKNQVLQQKLSKCLEENNDLIECLTKVNGNIMNIIWFLVSVGVNVGTISNNDKLLLTYSIIIEDIDMVKHFIHHKYGNECDYELIIIDNDLLSEAAQTNVSGSTTSFLLSKVSRDRLKDVVNDKSKFYTALQMAALCSRLEVAKVLIDNGADVNLRDQSGSTALNYAVQQQNVDMVELILYKSVIESPLDLVKTSEKCQYDNIIMVFVIYIGKCFEQSSEISPNPSLINSLMSLGAGECSVIEYDLTSLVHSEQPIVDVSDVVNAATRYHGNQKLMVALIGNVALKYPNYLKQLFCSVNGKGETLLLMAARLGYVAVAELMIGLGADIDNGIANCEMAMSVAAKVKNVPTTEKVIVLRANNNIQNDTDEVAICVAAKSEKVAFVLWLLLREDETINKAVNSVDIISKEFTVDLLIGIINELTSVQSRLLTQRYVGGKTILHIAAQMNIVKLAKIIIDKGADIDVRNDDNHTPLSLACKNGCLEMTRLLISEGASVNDGQQSPLLWAIYCCSHDIVRLLVAMGADCNAKCPFALANNECTSMLTPLHMVVHRCPHQGLLCENLSYIDVAKIFIFKATDVTTCLDYFPLNNVGAYADLIAFFIMCGADIYAPNSEGVSLVTYLEEHWRNVDDREQKILRSVFLYSPCKRPEQLLKTIRNHNGTNDAKISLDFLMKFQSQTEMKFPEFLNLLSACKANDIRHIQQHLHNVLVSEKALNEYIAYIHRSFSSEFPDKDCRSFGLNTILNECIEMIAVSISLLVKGQVGPLMNGWPPSFYKLLESLSEHCDKYFDNLQS